MPGQPWLVVVGFVVGGLIALAALLVYPPPKQKPRSALQDFREWCVANRLQSGAVVHVSLQMYRAMIDELATNMRFTLSTTPPVSTEHGRGVLVDGIEVYSDPTITMPFLSR